MRIDAALTHGLNVALNEATLVGVSFDLEARSAEITLAALSLPEQGDMPEDLRVLLVLGPVGRLAMSLRDGRWDDKAATVVPVEIAELSEVVESFKQQELYGWKFFNATENEFARWSNRLSLDWQSDAVGGLTHTLELFQEGSERHLDFQFWFDDLRVFGPDHSEIALTDFAAAGERYWKAMYAGDKRTYCVEIGTLVPLDRPSSD